MKKILQSFTEIEGADKSDRKQSIVIKMNDIETTLKTHQSQLDAVNSFINENIEGLQNRLFQMEREINLLNEKLQIVDVPSQIQIYSMQSGTTDRSDISTLKASHCIKYSVFFMYVVFNIVHNITE